MSRSHIDVKFFDVILCVSRALDLLSAQLSDHHLRVAYIGACLADQLGLSIEEKQDIIIAGALHDVGAVSSSVRLSLLDYQLSMYQWDSFQTLENLHRHGFDGYMLLRDFAPFANAAEAIRFHHVAWNYERGMEFNGAPVPFASHILHLADRIAVLPDEQRDILEQAGEIRKRIGEGVGSLYREDIFAAFEEASCSESFWLDLASQRKEEIVRSRFGIHNLSLDLDHLYELAGLFGRIIDYRSPFTAAHSNLVAHTSERLARLLHLDGYQIRQIGIAGFLHDLGKLAVPSEILDKPGKLTYQEMLVIKRHPYHTHRILSMVPGLNDINTFASLHHERLDGKGYPFRTQDIPLGARIISVADVLTALTEKRPYRPRMSRPESLAVLDALAADKAIDGDIVALVRQNFDELVVINKAY
jgi:HD-GYP domain-containing protein (c-di-GMP phosphodiesterase class II)